MFLKISLCVVVALLVVSVQGASLSSGALANDLAKQSFPQYPECGYSSIANFGSKDSEILSAEIDPYDTSKCNLGTRYSIYFEYRIGNIVSLIYFTFYFFVHRKIYV